MPLSPDQILGCYRIVRHLQSGGMGEIYEVYNTQLERSEAMKVLPEELAEQPDFVERFVSEARKNARLDHPHIVPVYQISPPDARPVYFTMKLIHGETLKQWYRGRLPMSEREAATLMLQICEALIYAHDQGLIHRDLKPANLMFDRQGRLYLMDFGIARAAQDTHLTQTGTQMGTAAYMSPEQAQDAKNVDARSDLYSLGVMLFEMLTGRTPFLSDSQISMALKHIQEPIPDPAELNPGLSPAVVSLIRALLEKDPAHRLPDAHRLRERLQAIHAAASEAVSRAPSPSAKPEANPAANPATNQVLPSKLPESALSEPPSLSAPSVLRDAFIADATLTLSGSDPGEATQTLPASPTAPLPEASDTRIGSGSFEAGEATQTRPDLQSEVPTHVPDQPEPLIQVAQTAQAAPAIQATQTDAHMPEAPRPPQLSVPPPPGWEPPPLPGSGPSGGAPAPLVSAQPLVSQLIDQQASKRRNRRRLVIAGVALVVGLGIWGNLEEPDNCCPEGGSIFGNDFGPGYVPNDGSDLDDTGSEAGDVAAQAEAAADKAGEAADEAAAAADAAAELADETAAQYFTSAAGSYAFTASRAVTPQDLYGISCDGLEIMRNEIFARHGRSFDNAYLRSHFESQPWYVVNPGFNEGMLNPIEQHNAAYILQNEKSGGCL